MRYKKDEIVKVLYGRGKGEQALIYKDQPENCDIVLVKYLDGKNVGWVDSKDVKWIERVL